MTGKPLTEATRRDLLALARRALEAHLSGGPPPRLGSDRAEAFGETRGLFVTLRRGGELRGCIGTLSPDGDLSRMVPKFAVKAAFSDPRFPPLSAGELSEIDIEISVLTPPAPLEDPGTLEIGRDGLIVEARGRSGLLLPQVATEWGFDRERFLAEVCRKAGVPDGAWRDRDAEIWTFQAEVFGEREVA